MVLRGKRLVPYLKILSFLLANVFLFGSAYFFINQWGYSGGLSNTATGDEVGYWDSIYFSFITSCSLGYGDIVPTGAARSLVMVEAVIGLVIFGSLISKFVSTRQETLVQSVLNQQLFNNISVIRYSILEATRGFESDCNEARSAYSEGTSRTRKRLKEKASISLKRIVEDIGQLDDYVSEFSTRESIYREIDRYHLEQILDTLESSSATVLKCIQILNSLDSSWPGFKDVIHLGQLMVYLSSSADRLGSKRFKKRVGNRISVLKEFLEDLKRKVAMYSHKKKEDTEFYPDEGLDREIFSQKMDEITKKLSGKKQEE